MIRLNADAMLFICSLVGQQSEELGTEDYRLRATVRGNTQFLKCAGLLSYITEKRVATIADALLFLLTTQSQCRDDLSITFGVFFAEVA